MRHRILVTDGEERASLAVVRSLGRAGYDPIVCSGSGRSLAGASRSCVFDERVPDALLEEGAYVERVLEICSRWRPTFLIPMTDPANVAILPARERFGEVEILGPDSRSYERISDKRTLMRTASGLGIAVPSGLDLVSESELSDSAAASLSYPAVIKPSRSVSGVEGRRVRTGVAYASSPLALRSALGDLPPAAFPVLIQEKIEGPGVGLFLLRWDGRTLAASAHRRIREKPPTGGVSVYREAIEPDPHLLDRCERLLDEFEWRGVAMVEFKSCDRRGLPYLMEVNGRFWGSLQLAIDAGIDFPAALVGAALGGPHVPARPYRAGVRCRWFWGDVDHTLALLRGTPKPDLASRLRAVVRLFRPPTRRDRWEVLRVADPYPFVRETIEWLGRAWTALRRPRKGTAVAVGHDTSPSLFLGERQR